MTPRRVILIFLLFGIGWIWLTDLALVWIGIQSEEGFFASSIKGSIFVLIAAVVLYWVVRFELKVLARSRSLIEAVVEGSTDAVFVKGLDGRYLLFNSAAARFVGKASDEVIGLDDTSLFDPAAAKLIMERDRRILATGQVESDLETGTAAGVTRTYLATKSPLYDYDGRLMGLIGVSRDITESRRLTEEATRVSALHEAIIGSAWEGICACNEVPDFPFVNMSVWNDRMTELTGYTQDEVNRHGWYQLMYPDFELQEKARDRMARMRTGDNLHGEIWTITRKDGVKRLISITTAGLAPSQGQPTIVAFFQDVTDRTEVEQTLRQSEQRFRELADAIPQIVWTADPQGGLTHLNEQAAEYTGLGSNTLLSWSWDRVIHPDDLAHVVSVWTEAVTSGIPRDIEFRIRRADGVYRWHVARQVPSRDGNQVITGWYGTCTDVEEIKSRSNELRQSLSRIRATLESTADAILVVDLKGRFVDLNRQFTTLWRMPEEVVAQARIENIVAMFNSTGAMEFIFGQLVDPIGFANRVAELYQNPEESSFDILEFRDGRTIERYSQPQLLDGKPVGRVWSFRDVTARRQTEQALRTSEARLRTYLDHAFDAFFAYTSDGVVVDVNQRACESLGRTREELIGTMAYLFDPNVTPEGMAELLKVLSANGVVSFESQHRHVDGTVFPVEIRIRGFEAGGERRNIAFARDLTEQRKAEAAIRQSEERFRALVEYGQEGINILGADGWSRYSSPRNADLVGLSPGETDDDTLSFVHPEDRPTVQAALAKITLEPDREEDVRIRLVRKNGTTFWVEAHARNLFAHPAVQGIVVNWRDVSERLAAEEQLRLSEEKYRFLMNSLPTAVHVIDDGHLTYCNPASVALFGAKNEAALFGLTPYQLVHPDSHRPVASRINSLNTHPTAPAVTVKILRLDGETRIVRAVAIPYQGHRGDAHIVCLHDVTEQEKATALLHSVLGSVGDAILTVDEHGIVKSANEATTRAFGYQAEEMIGRNVNMLMPEPYHSAHDQYITNYLRTGIAKVIGIGREVEARRLDGTTFHAELTISEFQLDGNRHFTGVLRDITERKKLEAQLRQAQKLEAIGRLAGGVAHDFNNLLTVINGYCDILQSELPTGDRRREYVAAIGDAGERASRLTQQLLAFSRKAVVEPKILDMNEIVVASAGLLRRLIGEDIVLAVVTDPALGRIKIDPGQFEQVILNLAVNARDAMPTGGRLTIQTLSSVVAEGSQGVRSAGRYACLRITDTGCGMTDDVKANIFEPFFTTKGVGKGTGLGLAVVHGVIEGCGGWIDVESQIGVGTSFIIGLPVVQDPVQVPGVETVRIEARGAETILLVEDEDSVRTIARLALELQGYTVLEADSGATAAEVAANHPGPIQLLVSDVVMPEMNGRQLLEMLRASHPGLRVLFMSGYTDDAVVLHGVVESRDAFIQKPFTPLSLARKVRAVLDAAK